MRNLYCSISCSTVNGIVAESYLFIGLLLKTAQIFGLVPITQHLSRVRLVMCGSMSHEPHSSGSIFIFTNRALIGNREEAKMLLPSLLPAGEENLSPKSQKGRKCFSTPIRAHCCQIRDLFTKHIHITYAVFP